MGQRRACFSYTRQMDGCYDRDRRLRPRHQGTGPDPQARDRRRRHQAWKYRGAQAEHVRRRARRAVRSDPLRQADQQRHVHVLQHDARHHGPHGHATPARTSPGKRRWSSKESLTPGRSWSLAIHSTAVPMPGEARSSAKWIQLVCCPGLTALRRLPLATFPYELQCHFKHRTDSLTTNAHCAKSTISCSVAAACTRTIAKSASSGRSLMQQIPPVDRSMLTASSGAGDRLPLGVCGLKHDRQMPRSSGTAAAAVANIPGGCH